MARNSSAMQIRSVTRNDGAKGAASVGSPVKIPKAAEIVSKELRIIGCLGVDTPAYRAAIDLLVSRRYPFETLPRRVAGLHEGNDMLRAMAGDDDRPPPVHAVIAPWIGA